jgi:hypothetical protein
VRDGSTARNPPEVGSRSPSPLAGCLTLEREGEAGELRRRVEPRQLHEGRRDVEECHGLVHDASASRDGGSPEQRDADLVEAVDEALQLGIEVLDLIAIGAFVGARVLHARQGLIGGNPPVPRVVVEHG